MPQIGMRLFHIEHETIRYLSLYYIGIKKKKSPSWDILFPFHLII